MNVDYFIKKFEAIPDALWCTGFYIQNERRCATGHCGYYGTAGMIIPKEAHAFWDLFKKLEIIPSRVNDGEHPDYQQPTPKARILTALRDLAKL